MKSAVMLALARLGLTVLSFQTLLRVVKRLSVTSPGTTFPQESAAVARVHWGVDRASRWVPGARNCLTRALVAHVLLARRGRPTELRIGVCHDDSGQLAAHAWLESEGQGIFGVPASGLHQYHTLPPLDRA